MAQQPKRRKLSNYLLDRSFQLKHAGFISSIALFLSVVLGLFLWTTNESLISQSRASVNGGKRVVALGKVVSKESRKVSAVVRMNLVEDPIYSDNPELLAAFNSDNKEYDARLDKQEAQLEAQAAALEAQAVGLEVQQKRMLYGLFGALTLLVIGVGLASIVITHRIAGPMFKMTRQVSQLGGGDWRMPDPLREGDELMAFFETWSTTVGQLREDRELQLERLDSAIAALGEDNDATKELTALRDNMQAVLDA
jgi:hypothetical protein